MKLNKLVRDIVLLLFLLPFSGTALSAGIDKNVIYGMYSGLALLMDIYQPENSNGRGLIMIPGSGWEAPLGYSAAELKMSFEVERILGVKALNRAGYTVFVINHRATPRFQYPAPVEDAQRAVRYIRHHARIFGIDPQRIGAIGGSSGGHLVSLLGTLDGEGIENDPDPVNQLSAKVQVVVAVYPVTDTSAFKTTNPWAAGALTALVGPVNPFWKPPSVQDADASRLYQQASPLYHLSPDDAPFLLVHGDADSIIPFSQSQVFYEALKEQGIATRLIVIKGGEHGPGLIRKNSPHFTEDMLRWLDHHLLD